MDDLPAVDSHKNELDLIALLPPAQRKLVTEEYCNLLLHFSRPMQEAFKQAVDLRLIKPAMRQR